MTIIPKKALIRCLMGCHDFFGVHQTNWKLANVRGKWQNSDLIWISIQVSSQNLSAMHVVITDKEVSEWDSQSGDSNCVSPDATTVGSNGNHSPSLRHHLRQLRGPHRFEGSDAKRHQSWHQKSRMRLTSNGLDSFLDHRKAQITAFPKPVSDNHWHCH